MKVCSNSQLINSKKSGLLLAVCLSAVIAVVASVVQARAERLEGAVHIDGSSTVFPISEAVAEEFQGLHPRVRVTVGISGTGGGFKKFCVGETDISDASRPIKASEVECARKHGVEYIELPVAFDGISVVVNPANDFMESVTVEELRKIWQRGGAKRWSEVRKGWPDREIRLYGPGTDSGTFDYFVEAILGKGGEIRSDFTASEDDNVLVQGVAGDRDGLGFFGYAYYVENSSRLNLVAVDSGNGAVAPSTETINDGTYAPLSRPIFIYPSKSASKRPEVAEFVRYYLQNAAQFAAEVGYVALPAEVYRLARERFDGGKTGSVFAAAKPGKSIVALLSGD